MSPAEIVLREVGARSNVRVTGALAFAQERHRRRFAVAPGLASSTNVWKKPCEPSAKSQSSAGPSAAVPVCAP